MCVCVCVFSCSVVSVSLWPCGLWPARLFCGGVFQAGMLKWAAISFSRGSSQPRYQTCVSHTMGRFFAI